MLRNEKLHKFWSSLNIEQGVKKKERMRKARHLELIWDTRNVPRFYPGNFNRRVHVENLELHERLILLWILKIWWEGGHWIGWGRLYWRSLEDATIQL